MAGNVRAPSKIARRLLLTPLVSRSLENWLSFMYHYALGLVPQAPYRFRNGARLRIGRGIDHVPIIEVFLREDYGKIPDDAVVVDVGASIGVFSVYAAVTARNIRLYAYEPMPEFFRLMQMNVELNRLSTAVACFNLAVAGEAGERNLFSPGAGLHFPTLVPPQQAAAIQSMPAACTTLADILDSNALPRVDLLKMDIEGAEYETLYATSSSCFGRIREIRMEYHEMDGNRHNVRSLKEFLVSQRYRITRQQANTPTNGNLWAEQR